MTCARNGRGVRAPSPLDDVVRTLARQAEHFTSRRSVGDPIPMRGIDLGAVVPNLHLPTAVSAFTSCCYTMHEPLEVSVQAEGRWVERLWTQTVACGSEYRSLFSEPICPQLCCFPESQEELELIGRAGVGAQREIEGPNQLFIVPMATEKTQHGAEQVELVRRRRCSFVLRVIGHQVTRVGPR